MTEIQSKILSSFSCGLSAFAIALSAFNLRTSIEILEAYGRHSLLPSGVTFWVLIGFAVLAGVTAVGNWFIPGTGNNEEAN